MRPDDLPLPRSWPKQPTLESFRWRPSHSSLPSLLDLPHRVLTHSGRAAIGLALEEIGIQPGEAVLVPTYHCPTMIAPVERLGATPVFYGLDSNGMPLLSSIADDTRLRAALVPHLFGIPRPMSEVAEFCRARRIMLIEDCAHCFFGRSTEAAVGTVGDYAIGSLPKFFPTLEGGILASSRHPIRAQLPVRRSVGQNARALWDSLDISARAGRLGWEGEALCALTNRGNSIHQESHAIETEPVSAVAEDVRQNALADPLLSLVGIRVVDAWLVTHTDLESNIHIRRRNYRLFAEHFADVPRAVTPVAQCPSFAAPYVFPLTIDQPNKAYRSMRAAKLPVFRWDRVWPDTPFIPGDAGNIWARNLIQFACHQSLSADDIKRVAMSAKRCL